MPTSAIRVLPLLAAAVAITSLAGDVHASNDAWSTSRTRVLATAEPRPLALGTPPAMTATRVPGASFTLNKWGPARLGSATPPPCTSGREPRWRPRHGDWPPVAGCGPSVPRACPPYFPANGTAWVGSPAAFGVGVVLSGGGGGLTLSVGLPCGCSSVLACSHRR